MKRLRIDNVFNFTEADVKHMNVIASFILNSFFLSFPFLFLKPNSTFAISFLLSNLAMKQEFLSDVMTGHNICAKEQAEL